MSKEKREQLTREAHRRAASVRDDPHGRLAMADDAYIDASNGRLQHFARAELAFIEWEVRRGVLDPVGRAPGKRGGSAWWRTVNERLLRDCEEASLLYREGFRSGASNKAAELWLDFFATPSAQTWYRAHNASIVSGYLDASPMALRESEPERVLMNVILTRALYAYMLSAREARLGWLGVLARFGQWLANPAGEGIVAVIDLPDFYPGAYPMSEDEKTQLLGIGMSPQALLGRVGNFVIFQDIQRVFTWNAERTGIAGLLKFMVDGSPCYPGGMPVLTAAARDATVLHKVEEWYDAIADAVVPDFIENAWSAWRSTRKKTPAAKVDWVPWVAGVSLQDVCFVSWEVPVDAIRSRIPKGLEIDSFDGKTYVTAVALRSVDMHFRGMKSLPGAKDFLELNFRAYVRHNGRPGIWFFSIDAEPGSAFEWLADNVFRVPYNQAHMNMVRDDGRKTTFTSARADVQPSASIHLTYEVDVSGAGVDLEPGSLDEFICRRDSSFSRMLGRIARFEVHHPEWKMQPVTSVEVDAKSLFEAAGLAAPESRPIAYFSPRSDGVMYPPVPW